MSLSSVYGFETDDPKLHAMHQTRFVPQMARCIKDDPRGTYIDHHPFKKGDEVEINGLVGRADGTFEVSIPSVCGFYNADHFEIIENK